MVFITKHIMKTPTMLTSGHRAQSHLDGAGSYGSSLSLHVGKTSCHSGNMCQGATTGQPHGCPGSGLEEGHYTLGACPASSAGSTWWWCSPMRGNTQPSVCPKGETLLILPKNAALETSIMMPKCLHPHASIPHVMFYRNYAIFWKSCAPG